MTPRPAILFVSPDAQERAAFRTLVLDLAVDVLLAETVTEALDLAEDVPPTLVLTESALRDGTGVSLIEQLRLADPSCSGVIYTAAKVNGVPVDIAVLFKPCPPATLRAFLRDTLGV